MDKVVSGSTAFGLDMLRACRKLVSKDENFVYSPYSITAALAMTYLGAQNNSKTQMEKVLHFSNVENAILLEGFQKCSETLTSFHDVTLDIANLIYLDQQFKLNPEYIKHLQTSFKVNVKNVDFVSYAENARHEINQSVESATKEKIKNLLPENSVTNLTKLIILNAIYFKGKWLQPFDESNTEKKSFYITEKDTVEVNMMFLDGKFKYGVLPELKCSCLEIPYVGNSLSMIILLPDEIEGLSFLEDNLSHETLNQALNSLQEKTDVKLYLPRFKLEEGLSLKDLLADMGMSEIFLPSSADLRGISSSKDLYVSSVEHKAFIEVNEEGTEAAAATAVVVTFCCLLPSTVVNVNHPFVFIIRDISSGMVFFLGSIKRPTTI